MASGVNGVRGYASLAYSRQAQGRSSPASRLFGKTGTDSENSTSVGRLSTLQSGLTTQLQTSQSNSISALLNLLKDPGQVGSTGASTSGGSEEQVFAKIDKNGDGSISKDELDKAIFELRNRVDYQVNGADSQTDSTAAQALFNKMDTNGDGSVSKAELSAFRTQLTDELTKGMSSNDSTASGSSGIGSGLLGLVQGAIGKYMQFTPAGQGIGKIGSLLGIA